ncbi:prophage tail fiber N-terminal domain-containing protein [Yersinia aleksiciae]|uniref:phage tail fiber protein n=1 Tax=Yersinia aleksiciae TaxID=263819 RepID=UPI0025AB435A|nr:prophage tail fiber N-terminal domain-containing protein [Yersinia aleksiciae]MDN0124430.1 prophage tail fiber N-terminal domain-containing protein [Yersinia aleksiciae]
MSVTVSGIMINPVGEPVVNAQITLTAIANSLTVLNTFAATVRTDNVGAYRLQLEEGSYAITVAANGRSFVYGAVTLDNTTGPSTLNQLLKQQIMESELTPDVILYFRQIQQQVANDLATIKVLESSASASAISAGHSRDEAKQYATDLAAALATAKGYRDQSGASANAATLSQQKAAASETSAKASKDSASLSEQNAHSYRDLAQSAAATAANDASILAAEQTAAKITLAVKTDADRAVAARTASEQIKVAVDSSAQQVTQQLNEATQAASTAKGSKESAATSEGNALNSAAAANNSKVASAASAETARQNAVTTTSDKGAAKGFRDEAEAFAKVAKSSAESIDIPALEQKISSKLPLAGGTLTGGLVLRYSASITLTPIDATAYNWIHWTQVDGSPGWRMGRLEDNGPFYLRDYSAGGVTALALQKGQYIWTSGNMVRTSNNADVTRGRVLSAGNSGLAGNAVPSSDNAFLHPVGTIGFMTSTVWGGGPPTDISGSLPSHWETLSMGVSGTASNDGSVSAGNRKATISIQTYNRGSGWPQVYVRAQHDITLSPIVMVYHTNNTTVDSNGFLKKASPVVKLYGDGSSETNYESKGATSERISEGVYKISGVLGFNSDDAWGGVDGGIEIPLDINKNPLIWVDYSLEENGDLIIKTYHRTHPTSPAFAQNNIKNYEDGQPIDIPVGRFVDLRVQMPEDEKDSISIDTE